MLLTLIQTETRTSHVKIAAVLEALWRGQSKPVIIGGVDEGGGVAPEDIAQLRRMGVTLLVGFGGVAAELLHDVRLLPPDLSCDTIAAEIRKLRMAPLLDGFRGAPEADVAAVATLVQQLGRMMVANPAIREVDLNPVVVAPVGQGAVALDALITL